MAALQQQLSQEVFDWWGVTATLHFVGLIAQLDPGHWPLTIMDHSDQASDLGYHEAPDGSVIPDAKIFAADVLTFGDSLSATISHEMIEMVVDPTTERLYTLGAAQYAIEACDAVEDDIDGYHIGEVLVSDFVTPRYFGMANPTGDPRYDHRNLLLAGCPTLRPGGYSMYFADGQWKSTMARKADGGLSYRAIRTGGRMHRRAAMHSP